MCGGAPVRRKAHLPRAIHARKFGLDRARHNSRWRGSGAPEDDEHRSAGVKVQRNRGSSVSNLVSGGLDGAGVGMPKLCFPSRYAKAGQHVLGPVLLVRHKIDVAIAIAAMNPHQVGTRFRHVVLKVGRRLRGSQHVFNGFAQ